MLRTDALEFRYHLLYNTIGNDRLFQQPLNPVLIRVKKSSVSSVLSVALSRKFLEFLDKLLRPFAGFAVAYYFAVEFYNGNYVLCCYG